VSDAFDTVRDHAKRADRRVAPKPRVRKGRGRQPVVVVAADLVETRSIRDLLAKHSPALSGDGPPIWDEAIAAVEASR
jgi:hypothetical protein